MPETDVETYHLRALPTEILLTIFTYLPAKDLINCRQICQRWRWIVNALQRSEILWRRYCKKDFPDICMAAWTKSRSGLPWFSIYRSLSLWPRLPTATEERDEFAFASDMTQEIVDVKVLKNGIIGIHKRQGIVYYDLQTLEPSTREEISGTYLKYTETNDTVIIQNFHLHLFVVRTVIYNLSQEPDASFENVKTFLLADQNVYYVTLDDEVYVINLKDTKITAKYVTRTAEGIMCLGYKNQLNILTLQRNIYTVTNNTLKLACALEPHCNLLQKCQEYNFLEDLDWRIIFQWMFILRLPIPQGPLRDITTVRTYGQMVFVGSQWGVLRIYRSPNTEEFNLFQMEPIKQYNFMERRDCPVLSDNCPIIQIDVVETDYGHTVVAAMPKKIAVLKFTHGLKSSDYNYSVIDTV